MHPTLEAAAEAHAYIFYLATALLAAFSFLAVTKPACLDKTPGSSLLFAASTMGAVIAYAYLNAEGGDEHPILLVAGRVLFLGLCLNRVELPALRLGFFLSVGLVVGTYLSFYGFALAILRALMVFASLSFDRLQYEAIFRYYSTVMVLLLVNFLVWKHSFIEVSDVYFRVAEMLILSFSSFLVLLLPEKKMYRFREYVPSEPEKRSISLSGFEEVAEEEQN